MRGLARFLSVIPICFLVLGVLGASEVVDEALVLGGAVLGVAGVRFFARKLLDVSVVVPYVAASVLGGMVAAIALGSTHRPESGDVVANFVQMLLTALGRAWVKGLVVGVSLAIGRLASTRKAPDAPSPGSLAAYAAVFMVGSCYFIPMMGEPLFDRPASPSSAVYGPRRALRDIAEAQAAYFDSNHVYTGKLDDLAAYGTVEQLISGYVRRGMSFIEVKAVIDSADSTGFTAHASARKGNWMCVVSPQLDSAGGIAGLGGPACARSRSWFDSASPTVDVAAEILRRQLAAEPAARAYDSASRVARAARARRAQPGPTGPGASAPPGRAVPARQRVPASVHLEIGAESLAIGESAPFTAWASTGEDSTKGIAGDLRLTTRSTGRLVFSMDPPDRSGKVHGRTYGGYPGAVVVIATFEGDGTGALSRTVTVTDDRRYAPPRWTAVSDTGHRQWYVDAANVTTRKDRTHVVWHKLASGATDTRSRASNSYSWSLLQCDPLRVQRVAHRQTDRDPGQPEMPPTPYGDRIAFPWATPKPGTEYFVVMTKTCEVLGRR